MNRIYYSQVDSRWKNYPYPSPSLPNATIGSGGCGVACSAMVVSMLKQIVTPIEIADKFLKDGIRVNGGTSNKAFDSYLTEQYGLKVTKNWKLDDAVSCLKKGGIVVARCISGNGQLFTTGGHFIVFVGHNEGIIEVYDPYLYTNKFNTSYRKGKAEVKGTSVFVTYANMKEYGGYNELWCYEPTGIDTNKDETNIEPAKEVVDRETVGQTKKLKANCKLWSNPDLTGIDYSYLKNTSLVVKENVNNEVDKVYIPATGRTAYINIAWYTDTTTVANNSYKVMTVTAKSGLNVRAGAGTNYKVVTAYKYGTQVKVYSISNGWAKGTKGYMSAQYLK